MTTEEVEKRIIDACVKQIYTYDGAPLKYSVCLDLDEPDDGMTLIEIEASVDEDYGTVTLWEMAISSEDYDGNEIMTETASHAYNLDLVKLQKDVNAALCPETFRVYDLEEQYC